MATSLDAVLKPLDRIIETSIAERSALGYFPALYRRVTVGVESAIARSSFDDNERMERFDRIFAERYLDAYANFRLSKPCSKSWAAAFENSDRYPLTVLQHLLLGMNAHISFDLGIAAAEVAGDDPLSLKADFYQINEILGSLMKDTQRRLARIFGPLRLVDLLLGSRDEKLSMFSIGYARDRAWNQTLELCLADPERRVSILQERDEAVASFAGCLVRPASVWIRMILLLVRAFERGDVRKRIQMLHALSPTADSS